MAQISRLDDCAMNNMVYIATSIGTFDAGHSVIYRMHKPRTGVYIFVIEGEINVAGENLSRRAGVFPEGEMKVVSSLRFNNGRIL